MSLATKAAKSIKADLRLRWPDIPFRVRSSTFAGGSSVRISWFAGPTKEAVYKAVERYEEGTFDGMTDSYTYNTDPAAVAFRAKNGSARYIICQGRHAAVAA
jgi:hypothetical protein